MADRKISDLTALTTPASGDYLPIVDISEAAAADKNKRITVEELLRGAPDGTAGAPGIAFESDGGNGFYLAGTDTIGASTNGVNRLTLSTSALTSTVPISATSFIPTSSTIPTNGVYLPSANNVAISSNGTGRLFISDDGKIGIGTSTPSAYSVLADDLVIAPSTTSAGISLVASTGNYIFFSDLDAEGRGLITYQHGDDSLRFGTAGYERLYISSTGQIQSAGLGSAASPALSFTTDTNTGIYSPGADQVAISTNGTGRLFVDASGNVGVGQSGGARGGSGTRFLAKLASGQSFVEVQANGTSDANALIFSDGSTGNYGAYGYDHSNDSAYIQTAGNDRIRITSDGKVGLGTSSPNSLAEIRGINAGAEVQTLRLTNNSSTSGTSSSIIFNVSAAPADNAKIAAIRTDSPNAGDTELAFSQLRTGVLTECLRIDSRGRAGVGTSSPVSALCNTASAPPWSYTGGFIWQLSSANYAASVLNTNAGAAYGLRCHVNDATSSSYPLFISTGAGSGTARLVVNGAGNVGVGTTSPQKNFEVSASTGATIRLNSSSSSPVANDVVGAIEYFANDTSIYGLGIAASIDAIITNSFGQGGALRFSTRSEAQADAIERARITSSGQLLVGTTSSSAAASLILQGNSSASSTQGILYLSRGVNNPTDALLLGVINFSDSGHAAAANIEARRDGGTWTSGVSQPTRLVFSTTADGASSPTERMRINNKGISNIFASDGNVLFVRSSAAAGTTDYAFAVLHSATSTANGTVSFGVFTNGNVVNTNNSYGAISDIKLKENIVDATSQWSDIKALQVRKYNFKEGQTHTQIGLIAQEVELVSPGLVSESPDRDKEGNDLGTVTKSVNYSVLYMKAVKALQEAMERIETLEAKVAALESA